MLKKIRYSYWYFIAFIKKNFKFLAISSLIGFFIILFLINFFPYLNNLIFKKSIAIGMIGNYGLRNIPAEIANTISNPLITINEKGQLTPLLIKSWESIDQGKIYRIHLKQDLFWSDDRPFTSRQLKLNLKDVTQSVIDDYTIDFKLKSPLVIFPYYLTKPVITHPLVGIGGEYKVRHLKIKSDFVREIELIPNTVNLPVKIYKFYPNEDEVLNAYKKGEIDSFTTNRKSTANYFIGWNNTTISKEIDYSKIMVLFINNGNKLLNIKEIRKIIAYSMPAFPDYGTKAVGPIPPTSWAYNSQVKTYNYNFDRAKNLFNKNFTSTQSAGLTLSTFFDYSDIADIIKNELENVGFKVTIKLVYDIPDDFDLLLSIWNPPADPDQYYFWHSTQKTTNITKTNNIKVDKLLEDGRRIINPKQRQTIYKELAETVIDEASAIFLYHPFKYEIKRQ